MKGVSLNFWGLPKNVNFTCSLIFGIPRQVLISFSKNLFCKDRFPWKIFLITFKKSKFHLFTSSPTPKKCLSIKAGYFFIFSFHFVSRTIFYYFLHVMIFFFLFPCFYYFSWMNWMENWGKRDILLCIIRCFSSRFYSLRFLL